MNKNIIVLSEKEICNISGGKEYSTKEAICGTIAIIGGVALVYFILDPLSDYLKRKLGGGVINNV